MYFQIMLIRLAAETNFDYMTTLEKQLGVCGARDFLEDGEFK